jgi:hypothetical protein
MNVCRSVFEGWWKWFQPRPFAKRLLACGEQLQGGRFYPPGFLSSCVVSKIRVVDPDPVTDPDPS